MVDSVELYRESRGREKCAKVSEIFDRMNNILYDN